LKLRHVQIYDKSGDFVKEVFVFLIVVFGLIVVEKNGVSWYNNKYTIMILS